MALGDVGELGVDYAIPCGSFNPAYCAGWAVTFTANTRSAWCYAGHNDLRNYCIGATFGAVRAVDAIGHRMVAGRGSRILGAYDGLRRKLAVAHKS